MRASSHRVIFDGARVLAVLGSPGELSREPWFGRDAIRTAASWAGIADSAAAAALSLLAERDPRSPLEALAAGRIAAARAVIDALLSAAAVRAEREPGVSQLQKSILLRAQVAASAEALLDDAVRACGSRPLASGSALDRARRDLGVFLFQHRLDLLLARVGEACSMSVMSGPAETGAAGVPTSTGSTPATGTLALESSHERDKYAATLAALGPPERRFAHAFEAGCSIGVFTAQLAAR